MLNITATGKTTMKTILVTTLLVFGLIQAVYAQLTDTTKVQYRLSASGNIAKGNIDRVILNSEASGAFVNDKWGISSRNTFFYFENREVKADADFLSRNFIYVTPKRRLYPYLMFWQESNFRRKIEGRYQAGFGGSYSLLQNDGSRMKLSLSLTHEETRFVRGKFEGNTDTTSNRVRLNRLTLRLVGTHTFKSSNAKVSYEIWEQTALRSRLEPRFYGELNLDIPIIKHLSFRTTLLYAYEDRVYERVKEQDLTILFGITFSHR